jgi:hypothetical protein
VTLKISSCLSQIDSFNGRFKQQLKAAFVNKDARFGGDVSEEKKTKWVPTQSNEFGDAKTSNRGQYTLAKGRKKKEEGRNQIFSF